jgi:hypothetical protein
MSCDDAAPANGACRKDAHDRALIGTGRREKAGARSICRPPFLHPVVEGVENRRDHEWYDEEQHEGEYGNVDQTVLHS